MAVAMAIVVLLVWSSGLVPGRAPVDERVLQDVALKLRDDSELRQQIPDRVFRTRQKGKVRRIDAAHRRIFLQHAGRVVGGIVNPYDIQPPGGALLIVQQMPPPEPDEASLPREVPLHVRCHLGHGAPGMDHLAVDRTPPALARRGWRSTPQLDVDS